MKTETPFNPEESLRFIDRMIKTAQESVEDSSFYYLIWGWAVFIASISHYVLLQMQYEHNYLGWAVLMPLTAVITVIYSRKTNNEQQKVRSYIDELIGYVLIAFIVSLAIVLFFIPKLQINAYPMVMVTYATWLFISGGALKFKPLMIGGVINWLLGAAAFFVNFETQLLLLACAVLLGYIIPGYLLRNKYRSASAVTI